MPETTKLCSSLVTRKDKIWEYQQYYLGEKDEENRKCGIGQNHWTGAQSLESYTGHFTRNTMHGLGDYRWRHHGPENSFVTYEGHFYCNRMHGYGTMSYPDGRTFSGLFFDNVRFGPGVQSHADVHEDVGLWRGCQLVRLAWRPEGPSITPDFVNSSTGRTMVESHRIILTTEVETIGETNKAIELLKQCGADPRVAVERWSKVYPKHCIDLASPLCYTESFDRDYYNRKIHTLKEVDVVPEKVQDNEVDQDTLENIDTNDGTFYAWNNNKKTINMMKHSYKHDRQRRRTTIDLKRILSGPRRQFKPPGEHEIDCRTLLMAAYLDRAEDIAQLVNERNVHPDISDAQGNSAIMYATVGDQPDVIHFLVEAGANVDSYNDNCCTPLGVALMRYLCAENDLPPSGMLQGLLQPSLAQLPAPIEPIVHDWNITREQLSNTTFSALTKSPSKSARSPSSKKIKSLLSIRDQPGSKRKTETPEPKVLDAVYESHESISEEKSLYNSINLEYSIKTTDTFTPLNGYGTRSPVPYVFNVTDMVKETELDAEDDQKKPPEKPMKKMLSSKTFKNTRKTSKEVIRQHSDKEEISISSAEKIKANKLSKIMCTILQLLSDGADPTLVRCPQPALLMAVMSNSPDLIRHLVRYGANINENYHQVFHYTPLDVAISRTLTQDNLEMVIALLECGANAQHRLVYEQDLKDPTGEQIPGPTLLHIVLAKKTENDVEEDIRHRLLELLLEYNCNPTIQYKGRAAIDVAMSKGNEVLNIFMKSPTTDLNAVINNSNQSILVKMLSFPYFKTFTSTERLQWLTDLLLFGADPLIKCQNRNDTYQNIFVFAKNTLLEIDQSSRPKTVNPPAKPSESKVGKKAEKLKKDEKTSTKQLGKNADDVEDYRQAVDLVTDCARLIYTRWLQAKLMKELVVTIDKYKHRHWHMILKSYQGKRSTGLWLSPQRCLEIWDILSGTKKKMYKDQHVLTHLLSIVIFLSRQNYGHTSNVSDNITLTASLKDSIEADVRQILRQHKADIKMKAELPWKLSYVKPELIKQ
ncbi:ankyrin repeat and MYND domain-containing protein 1-like isoform X2 [Maniola jurtina]|nr:ankyrin repeat and MYND domain-containing protein 1-like isoform X2 [Maniola jurtina]